MVAMKTSPRVAACCVKYCGSGSNCGELYWNRCCNGTVLNLVKLYLDLLLQCGVFGLPYCCVMYCSILLRNVAWNGVAYSVYSGVL